LDVVGFTYLYQQIQLLGFGTSLISIVATSAEHPAYLSIFQLSERVHCPIQIFQLATIWDFLTVAQGANFVWASNPQHVRRALHSPLFHRRVQLWEIIQDSGSNSVRRFHMEKKLRSNEIGVQGCYFIRRLANNLGEPQRSYAINAIDRALNFWKAKPVRKPTPL
jgi:hypothetical protein